MRISIEATPLATPPYSGIDRCLLEIIKALCEHSETTTITLLVKASRIRRRHLLPRHRKLSVRMWKPRVRSLRDHDIHFAPAYLAVDGAAKRTVAWLHDCYAYHGINYSDAERRQRQINQVQQLLQASDHVVCISAATQADVLRFEPAICGPTSVVHHGVSSNFYPVKPALIRRALHRLGIRSPYVMFSGLLHENKNLRRLLTAFSGSQTGRGSTQLVVTGAANAPQVAELRDLASRSGIASQVKTVGYVDDASLRALYSGAEAFLFPSIAEGFGLPILEAMACGTAVLTSTHPACVEAAGGHAVLCDPMSLDAIADGIDAACAMNHAKRSAARDYASTQTWSKSAERLMEVFEQIVHLA